MFTTRYFLILLVFSMFAQSFSQTKVNDSAKKFFPPLAIPLVLSANFGELRTNHFHAGIDFKTQGTIGLQLFTIADGYVSRIKITTLGYGNALYITHKNGLTSVYGHLLAYPKKIDEYVKKYQYENEKQCVDLFPELNEFPVKKGDFIGLAGNSGFSFGPHLHFEIRNSKTQAALNVMKYGFDIKDDVKPKITALAIYPLSSTSVINNKNEKFLTDVSGTNGKYFISTPILVSGTIGFGIESYDQLSDATNKCSTYSIELFVDSILVYSHFKDKISFDETLLINTFMDYEEKVKSNKEIEKSFINCSYNTLSIYKNVKNKGFINFNDSNVHQIKYIVNDVYKNSSVLKFNVKATPYYLIDTVKQLKYDAYFKFDTINKFIQKDFKIIIPSYSLYENIFFTYNAIDTLWDLFSKLHKVHSIYTPLHKSYVLSIGAPNLPKSLEKKSIIVSISDKGKIESEGGVFENGFVSTRIRKFGNFAVAIDTIAPIIKALNISPNADMSKQKTISFEVTDDLSGVETYYGYIDNKWVLFEFDPKNKLIYYVFDQNRIQKGKSHELEFYVIDDKDNVATYFTLFNY